MQNLQPPEKRALSDGQELDVHSIFYTIQGEGPFSGTPAVFIRLAGCNLQCPLCDTEYTKGRQRMPIAGILKQVMFTSEKNIRGLVVITGGEPFRQHLPPLVSILINMGFFVQIETNGTLAIPDDLLPAGWLYRQWWPAIHDGKGVYVVVSPKTTRIHPTVHEWACAYKYVISNGATDLDDGLPTQVLDHKCYIKVARPKDDRPVYIQPADHQDRVSNERNITECIRSCIKHGYTLQLQVHKLIQVP